MMNFPKSLIDQANELQAVLNRCEAGLDTTTFEGKKQMMMNFFDQLDQWRDQWAADYLKALETADLSPAQFDALPASASFK